MPFSKSDFMWDVPNPPPDPFFCHFTDYIPVALNQVRAKTVILFLKSFPSNKTILFLFYIMLHHDQKVRILQNRKKKKRAGDYQQ